MYPSPPFASPNPSPPDVFRRLSSNSSPTPVQRVDNLLSTISSVLISYSSLPTASPIYITSLTQFHQRATSLSPNPNPPLTSPGLSSRSSSTSLSQLLTQNQAQTHTHTQNQLKLSPIKTTGLPSMNNPPGARSDTVGSGIGLKSPTAAAAAKGRRPSLHDIQESPSLEPQDPFITHEPASRAGSADASPARATGSGGPEVDDGMMLDDNERVGGRDSPPLTLEEQIDALEREWWTSEVVAAWYGPRPAPSHSRSRSSSSDSSRGRSASAHIPRGVGRGRRRSYGSVGGGGKRHASGEREGVNALRPVARGDASYVGLDDE